MTFTQDQLNKINMIGALEDVQDQLLAELQQDLRGAYKEITSKARLHTRHLIKYFDSVHSPQNQIAFGNASDEIRALLDDYIEKLQTNK